MKKLLYSAIIALILIPWLLAAGVGELEPWLSNDPSPKLTAAMDANSKNITGVAALGIGTASFDTGCTLQVDGGYITCPDPNGSTTGTANESFGWYAGKSMTSATRNALFGKYAGYSMTTGSDNFYGGFGSGYYSSGIETSPVAGPATRNVCIGAYAGWGAANQATKSTVAIGYHAAYANQVDYTVAIGAHALESNVTGDWNTAVGYRALSNATSGWNTAVGCMTLDANTTGVSQAAFGESALMHTTTGKENAAFGAQSLIENTVGERNAAFGMKSLDGNRASRNTGLGYSAGYRQSDGSDNIFIGHRCGDGDDADYDANKVTAVGADSLFHTGNADNNTTLGYRTGYEVTTGGNNILVGYQAGKAITTGASNIIIGYDIDPSSATASNELNIGGVLYGDLTNGYLGNHVTPLYALDITIAENGAGVDSTGGFFRVTEGDYAPNVIAGCASNAINDGASSCVIAGGGYNNNVGYVAANVINGADSRYSTISGGYDNAAEGIVSSILGGAHHIIETEDGGDIATHCTIAGGSYGEISGGNYNAIFAGTQNDILNSSDTSVIGGGSYNIIGTTSQVVHGTISGGNSNTINGGTGSVICGGVSNDTATASYSGVLGGIYCDATGDYSSALGGHSCVASGDFSLAWGRKANATAHGSVAFADNNNITYNNATVDSMAMRFEGGWKFSRNASNYISMVVQADGDVTFDSSDETGYDVDYGDGNILTTGTVTGGLRTTTAVPASAGAAGTAGDIAYSLTHVYICVAANTWKRAALTTW